MKFRTYSSCKTKINKRCWFFLASLNDLKEQEVKALPKAYLVVYEEFQMLRSRFRHHRLSQLRPPCVGFHYSCTAQPLESGLGRSPYTLRIHLQALLTETRHRAPSPGALSLGPTPALPVCTFSKRCGRFTQVGRSGRAYFTEIYVKAGMLYDYLDLCGIGNP